MAIPSPRANLIEPPFNPRRFDGDPQEHRWKLAENLDNHIVAENPHLSYVTEGHTNMYRLSPGPSSLTIAGTPIKITGFDTKDLPEVDATSDLANSTFTILEPGVWQFNLLVVFNVTPSSANNSPKIVLELFEDTQQTFLVRLDAVSMARYAEAVTLKAAMSRHVTQSSTGTPLSFYVWCANGLSVTTTQLETLEFGAFRVSNFASVKQ